MGDNRHTSDEHSAGKSTKPRRKGKCQKSVVFQTHYPKKCWQNKNRKSHRHKNNVRKNGQVFIKRRINFFLQGRKRNLPLVFREILQGVFPQRQRLLLNVFRRFDNRDFTQPATSSSLGFWSNIAEKNRASCRAKLAGYLLIAATHAATTPLISQEKIRTNTQNYRHLAAPFDTLFSHLQNFFLFYTIAF